MLAPACQRKEEKKDEIRNHNGDSDMGGGNSRDHSNEKITIRRQTVPGMDHIRSDAVLNLRVA
jgi:hypothetical protein